MTRVATPANEAMLLEDARHATGQQLELICRKYATVVRAAKEVDEDYDRQRRTVSRRDLEDGMVRIEATLHPEEAALVWAALDRVAREGVEREAAVVPWQDSTAEAELAPIAAPRLRSRISRADALIEITQGVVRGDAPRRSPVELVVTVAADVLPRVSAETRNDRRVSEQRNAPSAVFSGDPHLPGQLDASLAVIADGTCVSAETARRLACDCGIVHVTEDPGGNTLSVGRRTRSIPVAISRALLKRDQCCRFPGCGNRIYVEGHHIEHWADGGQTALDNLVSLCGFHHRFVHEYGYSVVLDDAQQPRFFDPSGSEICNVPARPRPEGLGWPSILDLNAGLSIEPSTNECLWDGEGPSYIDVLDALVRVDGLD